LVDRGEAEEDGTERGACLVVQLARDPAALGLLGIEDRVERFTLYAFSEMNGERGAGAEPSARRRSSSVKRGSEASLLKAEMTPIAFW
jgi:hypothetical protein